MKGPGHRYDIDIRRLWECPECGKQVRLPANVAHRQCSCHDKKSWMRLVPSARIRTFPVREKIVIPEEAPEPEDEMSLSEDLPQIQDAETTQEAPEETSHEPANTETVFEDSISSHPVTSEPDSDRGEHEEAAAAQAPPEHQQPTEALEDSSQTSNQQTSETDTQPRKKRRRKRNRRRDRKRKQSDPPPQNSDTGSTDPQSKSPPETRSEDFGSGV